MRDVRLPALVRHLRGEPDEGAPRSLLRLRGHEAPARQDPPDRRDRRDRSLAVTPGEVVGDRVSSRIQTLVRELLAQPNDLVFDHPSGAVRAPPRPPGPRLEAGLPFGIEPANELVDPPAGDPLVPGPLGLRAPLDPARGDDQPRK